MWIGRTLAFLTAFRRLEFRNGDLGLLWRESQSKGQGRRVVAVKGTYFGTPPVRRRFDASVGATDARDKMKARAFIEPPQVDLIEKTLQHCGRWQ